MTKPALRILLLSFLVACGLPVQSAWAVDADGDGIDDAVDNCLGVYNPDQRDTDGDGYGNLCDPDFDNNGVVNINDFNRLKSRLGITPVVDTVVDLDGNGAVNMNDLNRLKSYLGQPPGPSAHSVLYPDLHLSTGLRTIVSNGVQRTYYLKLPADYYTSADAKPVIMAFHGTTGTHDAWVNGYYDLQSVVGDGAVLVYPDALPNGNGVTQWVFDYDFQFFSDVVADLNARVRYNHNKLFVTGHSSGGGMAHEIGCRYGNIVRAIAPVAGALTSNQCVGAVAVMQIHGLTDSYAPVSVAEIAHHFWVQYNGFDINTSVPGATSPCVNYATGPSNYPVEWCLHNEGNGPTAHAWPSFASQAMRDFFFSLPEVAPGVNPPPGGGNGNVSTGYQTTISFTLHYPPGIGVPEHMAVALYDAGTHQPLLTAPVAFLNTDFPPGNHLPGDEAFYQVPVTYFLLGGNLTFPGTYTVAIVVYMQGGGYPIPTTGVDYTVLRDTAINSTSSPIVIPETLTLEPVQSF